MRDHFFVYMQGINQWGTAESKLLCCHAVDETKETVHNWLMTSCGVNCRLAEVEKASLALDTSELTMLCPALEKPADIERYNGYYFSEVEGSFTLFTHAFYDEKSADMFRKSVIREYGLESMFSEEAEHMMDMLEILVQSFREEVDFSTAQETVDIFLKSGGLIF